MKPKIKKCCMTCSNIDVDECDLFACIAWKCVLLIREEAELLYCNAYVEMPTPRKLKNDLKEVF